MTAMIPATRRITPKTSVRTTRPPTLFVQHRASQKPPGKEARATMIARTPKKFSIYPGSVPCPGAFGERSYFAACTRAATFKRKAFKAMKPVASFWL